MSIQALGIYIASLASCFLVSAAKAAAPTWMLASFRVAGVRGVTMTSQAADLALSHPSISNLLAVSNRENPRDLYQIQHVQKGEHDSTNPQ